MDVAGGLSLVQTILQLLDSTVWKETQSVLGVKSQLHKLKKTMFTIEAILRDAEEQERLHPSCSSYSERDRHERLKEALYQANDLFEEVTTFSHRKKLMPGNKLSKEVSLFFSQFNQLRSAVNWSRVIKSIGERLDDVVKDHQLAGGFRHSVVLEDRRVRNNPRETHSYVNMENDVIIGRDDDKRNLIDMLLDTTVEENVSVVTIVGIGGLGKTTLAQLVYNDDRIREEFPLKMWVCVSDDFNVKVLAAQILAVATNQAGPTDGLTMDQLQKKLRQVLERNKFLLVLDDVWNENYEEWHNIKSLLVGGGIGSRVLVTSRSKQVADVVGSCKTQELKGLSDDESLALFQKKALKPEDYPMKPQLAIIGKEIVRKCANVPLAIRVVGSLLRGQGESKWENLKDTDLANIIQDEANGIVPVLKISYNYLPFHLKRCFSYCAVFPKDYKIVKMDLIRLWMAQGFIMPSNGESFEDAGEEYFKQLLQRCFFQDVDLAEGTLDEAISCKMHDLVHDLAKEVAGAEILSCDYSTQSNTEKTRHVFLDRSTPKGLFSDNLIEMKRTRTFLIDVGYLPRTLFVFDVVDLFEKISKMKCLRALSYNANYLVTRTLLSAIGKLLHLRYLDLSHNQYLLVLPSSITNLYNLQTLKLCWCQKLERLPMKLGKLVNLRHLDIYGCSSLICMPPDMNRMTYLHNLTGFVVGGTSNVWCSGSAGVGELVNLEIFTRHSEILEISVQGVRYNAVEAREQGFLCKSQRLREIKYCWRDNNESDESDNAETLLQSLQPNSYLRRLELWNYSGVRLPIWMMNLKSCLPNLVVIQIRSCRRLEHLPWMSQLHHLKSLILNDLHGVEYMEGNIISGDEDDELVFFPSLENLKLWHMPNLKGWWKPESGKGERSQVAMLSRLGIQDCPNLTTFPFCPNLEKLVLINFNEALGPIMREPETTQQKEEGRQGRLTSVMIDNLGYLNSLPIQSFHHLSHLMIANNHKMERLRIGEGGKVFVSGRLSSLRSLVIYKCNKLKCISGRGVWEHSPVLESLTLEDLHDLELEDEDDVSSVTNKSTAEGFINNEGSDTEMPWRYLAPTLRSLELIGLPKAVKLPKGIDCLSSLQSLSIRGCGNLESLTPSIDSLSSLQSLIIDHCPKLKTMPEEMRHLTSLAQLHVRGCNPELKKRCKSHTGIDWPNIQHIPRINVEFFPDSSHCWKNSSGQ